MKANCSDYVLDELKELAGSYWQDAGPGYIISLMDAPVSSLPGEKGQALCECCVTKKHALIASELGEEDVFILSVELQSSGKMIKCDNCKIPLQFAFNSEGAKRTLRFFLDSQSSEIKTRSQISPERAWRLYKAFTTKLDHMNEELAAKLQSYDLKCSSILRDIQIHPPTSRKKLRI